MNSLLSALIALAMTLTGGAAGTASLTVSDTVVSLNGTDYLLKPSVTASVAADETGVTADAYLTMDGDTLMPVQLRADENGIAWTVGNEGEAYLLDASLIDTMMGDEDLTAYEEFVSALPALTETQITVTVPDFASLLKDADASETEITLDGETVPATRYTGTLDAEAMGALTETLYGSWDDSVLKVCFDMLNEMTDDPDEQITSYADMFEASGITANVDTAKTEDGRSITELSIGAGEDLINIPVKLTVYSDTRYEISCSFADDISELNMSESVDGDTMLVNMTAADEAAAETFDLSCTKGGAGTVELSVKSEEYGFNASANWDGTGVCAVNVSFDQDVNGEPESYGVSFTLKTDSEPITDRFAGREQTVFASEEELDTGMMMMYTELMDSVADDISRLSEESGIAALAEVFGEMTETGEEAEDVEDEYTTEATAEDLSFALPTFTYLPEGYALGNPEIYKDTYSEYVNYTIDYQGDGYRSSYYVTLYKSDEAETKYYLTDGTALESNPVKMMRYDGYIGAETVLNGNITTNVYYYDSDIDDSEILKVIEGIRW